MVACCTVAVSLTAQTVKTIGVGQDAPYTDHVALLDDSRDMDLMVKFVFNEAENQLTVSLISYRSLFVFREDTRYKMAVKCKKLRPERFPYLVEAEDGTKFKLTKDFRRSIPKPRKSYVFRRWVEYDGLQPAPMEYKMVNDFIEQTFDIVGKRDNVTLTLRDILVMEQKKKARYEVFFKRDLDTRYQIQLLRNPCLGLEEEIAAAVNARDAVAKAYGTLSKQYGRGYVVSQEAFALYHQMKDLLMKQYEPLTAISPCPDIQEARDAYNLYVDSIARFRCVLREESPVVILEDDGEMTSGEFDAQNVLSVARQIDNMVSRWMVSNDAVERHDLVRRCSELVQKTSVMIGNRRVRSAEHQRAIDLFRSAEKFFEKTCGKTQKSR